VWLARPDDGEGALQVAPAHVRVGLRGDRGRGREGLLRHQRGQRHGRARARAAAAARLRERGLQVGQRGRRAQAERLAEAAQELPGLDHACAARARASAPSARRVKQKRARVAARRACEQRLRQQAAAGRQPGRRRHVRARQAQVLALRRAGPRRPAAGRALRAPLQLGRLPLPARRRPRVAPSALTGRSSGGRARKPAPLPLRRPGGALGLALARLGPAARLLVHLLVDLRAAAYSARAGPRLAVRQQQLGGHIGHARLVDQVPDDARHVRQDARRRLAPHAAGAGPPGPAQSGSRVGSPPAPAAGPQRRLLRCTAGAGSAAYSQGARMRPQGEEQRRAPLARLRRVGHVRGSALARPVVLCGARRALARLPHAQAAWLI